MHHWQKIITPSLASVGGRLKLLESAFDELAVILHAEYNAIRDHNIKKLEEHGRAKAQQSERVERLLLALAPEIAGLSEIYRASLGGEAPPGASLATLKRLVEAFDDPKLFAGSPYQIAAAREVKRLQAQIVHCQEKFAAIKLEIEKNRFVLSRLLHNHQQSYKFWQSTLTEASSSYDRSGHRRNPEVISQFHTKV